MQHEGVRLGGGNMAEVVRYGAYVHRTSGPWTPTVHRLLTYLASRGVTWAPVPAGFDEHGREIVNFLPGAVPHDPMPGWVWADDVLVEAARHLVELHDVTAGYMDPHARWQLPAHRPQEVICHNDFVPYNMVFDVRCRLVGVIDWDTASPGPRVWDLAYLAYRLVPLSAPGDPDGIETSTAERRRRLQLLCRSYSRGQTPAGVVSAAIERLHELADFTAGRAAASAPQLQNHIAVYLDAARWLSDRFDEIAATN